MDNATMDNATQAAIAGIEATGVRADFSSIKVTIRRMGLVDFTHFRQLDRALQRLRRSGRIAWDSKAGWRIVAAEHKARGASNGVA